MLVCTLPARPLEFGVVNAFVLMAGELVVLRLVGNEAAILVDVTAHERVDHAVINPHGPELLLRSTSASTTGLSRRRWPSGRLVLRDLVKLGFIGLNGHAGAAEAGPQRRAGSSSRGRGASKTMRFSCCN